MGANIDPHTTRTHDSHAEQYNDGADHPPRGASRIAPSSPPDETRMARESAKRMSPADDRWPKADDVQQAFTSKGG